MGQLALLILAIAFFATGVILSLARMKWDARPLRPLAKAFDWGGVATALGVLVWHSARRGNWLPLDDNFDAFLWIALLLSLFVLYVQRTRPLGGLDWFVIPIVIALLISGGLLGSERPQNYNLASKWMFVHRATAYSGAVAFAVAAAVGSMYLISNRRLRSQSAPPGLHMGSLERLEHLTLESVTVGFALLTIGLVTGLIPLLRNQETRLGKDWLASPKVLLGLSVWVVYALVLHSPINPSFRGRKAAMLSIIGFVLMIGALAAVQFMPGK